MIMMFFHLRQLHQHLVAVHQRTQSSNIEQRRIVEQQYAEDSLATHGIGWLLSVLLLSWLPLKIPPERLLLFLIIANSESWKGGRSLQLLGRRDVCHAAVCCESLYRERGRLLLARTPVLYEERLCDVINANAIQLRTTGLRLHVSIHSLLLVAETTLVSDIRELTCRDDAALVIIGHRQD